MRPFPRSQTTAPDSTQSRASQRSSGPDAGLSGLSQKAGFPNGARDAVPRASTPEAAEQAAIDAAVAERLLNLLDKAERRGQFSVAEPELLRRVRKDFGIPLNLGETIATRLADTGQVGRSPTRRGPVLHRDLSLSERTIRGILHVIHGSQRNGHAALPRSELTAAAAKRLLCSEQTVLEGIDTLIGKCGLVAERIDGDFLVFTAAAHGAEVAMVRRLMELTASSAVMIPRRRRMRKTISRAEKRSHLVLNAGQAEAIATILGKPVSLITGAPGVGKTTVIRAAVDALARVSEGKPILLAAPTGKAARRLSEAAKHPAQTIHRLLCWSPEDGGGFTRDEDSPLEAFAIIVDEASMIDLVLMADLLTAIPRGCRLVLVGDPDQLPPVAFGQPFADMLSCGRLPTARLSKILRQSEGSAIPEACRAIRNGQVPRLVPYGEKAELRLLKAPDPDLPAAASRVVRDLVQAGHNPLLDLQVLAPTKEKSYGVYALNEVLAPICNPGPDPAGPTCRLAGGTGRIGDKVQQLENDYDKGVFNGDQGRIIEIAHEPFREPRIVVLFDTRDVPYTASEAAGQLALAYAITIHRSQGSEWKSVVLCLPAQARRMLTRNLLYTALSRGKGQAIVIGQEASLQQAVRIDGARRRGGLEERLRQHLPPLPS